MSGTGRQRLDERMLADGLSETRSRAQSLTRAGRVLVDDTPVDKPGTAIRSDARVRVRGEAGKDPVRQVRHAFRLAFARDPEPEESARMLKLLASSGSDAEGCEALCRVLFNSSEFSYVD